MKLGIVESGVIVQDSLTITTCLKEIEITAICYTKRSEFASKDLTIVFKVIKDAYIKIHQLMFA